ncbi:uncharacterized protein P884DRAFT_300858 [Thermothelomyces heterothallicus CBS 202.75]|uniref:uncharacterized protein n=1 Tax=Thermothelomyces heterothallicus CBS 202.75 TaxID=1149848 RepID=UPI003742C712
MLNKILIFTGAPEKHALDWSASGLLTEFEDAIARFAGLHSEHRPPSTTPAPKHAAWRSLPLANTKIGTGFSQHYGTIFDDGLDESASESGLEFLDTVTLPLASGGGDSEHDPARSQFYEHSMAAHDSFTPSQPISQSAGQETTSFISDRTSSFLSGDGSRAGPIKEPLLVRGSDLVSDLKNIPSATYLLGIQPQTFTCNLIVGIISISQPRAVKTRWGATKYLVELLVGDETKAGFAITYWLPSDNLDDSPLAGLRVRDIILLQNVAFNVFTNKVYGSSVRKNWTKVHLLYRMKLDSRDPGGYYSTSDLAGTGSVHPQLDKTRRVRDWVLNFVGRQTRTGTNRQARWNQPPADDTQL